MCKSDLAILLAGLSFFFASRGDRSEIDLAILLAELSFLASRGDRS